MGYLNPVDPGVRRGVWVLGDLGDEQLEVRVRVVPLERLIGPVVFAVDVLQLCAQGLGRCHGSLLESERAAFGITEALLAGGEFPVNGIPDFLELVVLPGVDPGVGALRQAFDRVQDILDPFLRDSLEALLFVFIFHDGSVQYFQYISKIY